RGPRGPARTPLASEHDKNSISLAARWSVLRRGERRQISAMSALILGLHILGWGTLVAIVVPQHLRLGASTFGLGIGVSAYILGARHAFDADHIAAIDNTTRRLMGRGERPVSVGFWFALGHSTIVFGLALLIAVGARALPHQLLSGHSGARSAFVTAGTVISGCFLYAVAALNLGGLVRIWRRVRRLRSGSQSPRAGHHADLCSRGILSRVVSWIGRPIDRPWHMYLVGLLFGLGFDTATEVALLVLAGTGSASGLPWYATLCLPVLFAAGMSLFDTLDGTFMHFAYGWSIAQPVRALYYNLTITGLSIAVALLVGSVELLGLLADKLGLHHGPWSWAGKLDLGTVGFFIVGLFLFTWLLSLLIWRYARIEQRWAPSSEAPVVPSQP
ncbi:MAG: HoxN/HupN/NixA family nickel/cobalt transporter, partial [Solirubrobacteraceae bacterium]